MEKKWEDLEVKTFLASSIEEIDKLVNDFRKNHQVRFVQAYACGTWHARMISFVTKETEKPRPSFSSGSMSMNMST